MLGIATQIQAPKRAVAATRPVEEPTNCYRRTGSFSSKNAAFRNQESKTPGSVVVLGDVNPGAEIIAGGNVIIWGRMRGTAQAGIDGDETAIVCALEMSP